MAWPCGHLLPRKWGSTCRYLMTTPAGGARIPDSSRCVQGATWPPFGHLSGLAETVMGLIGSDGTSDRSLGVLRTRSLRRSEQSALFLIHLLRGLGAVGLVRVHLVERLGD